MTPEVEQLIHDVLHGQADEQQLLRLSAWIAEHEDHAKAYCRVVMDERAIRACLERETSRSLDLLAESPDDSRAGSLLAELALAEASATTLEHGASQAPVLATMDCDSSGALTKQQYMSALSYVLRHSFTPKRLAMLATAAALLFGVVLTVALLLGPDDGELMVQLPDQPESSTDGPSTPTQLIVATLTDEHDAVWDRRPGQDLYPGQRLTLTQGFAEITTNDGAIAILEAPATIELLDNNNALHLHAGKLVGICETESSKGFLVRTPDAELVDIGTVFGVEVSPGQQTQLDVIQGEVKTSRMTHDGRLSETQVVAAGQAVAIQKSSGVQRIAFNGDRFATRLPGNVLMAGDAILIDLGWRGEGFETRTNNFNNISGKSYAPIMKFGESPRILVEGLRRASDGLSTGVDFSIQHIGGDPRTYIGFGHNDAGKDVNTLAGLPSTVTRDTIFLARPLESTTSPRATLRFSGLDDRLTYEVTLVSLVKDGQKRPDTIFIANGQRASYQPTEGGVITFRDLTTDNQGNLDITWTLAENKPDTVTPAAQLDGIRLRAVQHP